MLKNKELYKETLDKSINWLLSQMNEDGTINPVGKGAIAYYKIPWPLILAGKTIEAKKIIDWIIKETLTSDGDLKSDKRNKFAIDFYTYSNAWTCLDAHLLSLFDISYKLWDFIKEFQDSKTGGYWSKNLDSKENFQSAISTAWTSLVGLHLGKLEEAKKAAKFLKMLLSIQPDFKNTFYYYYSPTKGLITEKPSYEPDNRFIRIDIKDREENFYYMLGAVISFLAKLYSITKDKEHLELAKTYYEFVLRGPESLFLTESAGKLCYASTYLYYVTAEEKYLELAEKFLISLLKIGEEKGVFWIRDGKATASSTAEFCVWRTNILFIGDGKVPC